jgi:hypothetical protein
LLEAVAAFDLGAQPGMRRSEITRSTVTGSKASSAASAEAHTIVR